MRCAWHKMDFVCQTLFGTICNRLTLQRYAHFSSTRGEMTCYRIASWFCVETRISQMTFCKNITSMFDGSSGLPKKPSQRTSKNTWQLVFSKVGQISWSGSTALGTCEPAPCRGQKLNSLPGPDCQCTDGYTGQSSVSTVYVPNAPQDLPLGGPTSSL